MKKFVVEFEVDEGWEKEHLEDMFEHMLLTHSFVEVRAASKRLTLNERWAIIEKEKKKKMEEKTLWGLFFYYSDKPTQASQLIYASFDKEKLCYDRDERNALEEKDPYSTRIWQVVVIPFL